MKKFIILTIILSIFLSYIVIQSVMQNRNSVVAEDVIKNLEAQACSKNPPRDEALSASTISSLRKVGEFESKCKSQVSSSLEYDMLIPENTDSAKTLATTTANIITEFSNQGISPIFFVKPNSKWTDKEFNNFSLGKYSAFLDEYFQQLTALNVTEDNIGTWVLFPEANLPYWNNKNISPDFYGKMFNQYATTAKKYYPNIKLSILLSSTTYETAPFNWTDKEYRSLLPYTKDINRENIYSVGIEGFPWIPAVNVRSDSIIDPNEYINRQLLDEYATALNAKTVWIYTGTFSGKYLNEEEKRVIVPPELRKKLLSETLNNAAMLQSKGYDVSIHLYAQDQTSSSANESTDWSYWGTPYTENPGHEDAVLDFLREANKESINVNLTLK